MADILNKSAVGREEKKATKYMRSLVKSLGSGGMSSESSGEDSDGINTVMYVNSMPWRNKIAGEQLLVIDRQRKGTGMKDNRGAKAVYRKRTDDAERVTKRSPPKGLPPALFDDDYRRELSRRERDDLDMDTASRFQVLGIVAA